MNTAAHVVFDALMDGRLDAKGREPGQLDYEPIPRTHWRAVSLSMVRDGATLWKMVIVPRGVSEITPEGEVIGHNKEAMELRNQLATYDSFIVSSRQFESLWPRKDREDDAVRKRLLKAAKKAGADPSEIKKLSRD